jgi:hypothetical protein
MDICRITRKEEFLAALAEQTRAEQEALLSTIARDSPVPSAAAVVLAIALPAVCLVFLARGPFLWVAAALVFSLLYPILLWLPALRHRRWTGEHTYFRTLWELGILGPGRRLGYLAANAFVINGRAAAPAFAWFAAVNLLVALGWILDPPARDLGLIIAVQAAIALGAGLTVWRLTPGVGHLRARAASVRAGFAAHRAIGWALVLLLTVPVVLAAAIFIPQLGLTESAVSRVLAEGHVSPQAQALEFVLLFAGLYGIARAVQSRESRRLARQVAEAILRYVDTEITPMVQAADVPAPMDCEEYRVLATGLLEARVYRFERTTLAGRLPLYTLSPDLSLVADPETLAALRGHLSLEPAR